MVETDKANFFSDSPLLLHWDGKLLPAINESKQATEWIAIIVRGVGIEKLLAVPTLGNATGRNLASTCLQTIESWHLRSKIQGLIFDTTTSNTGLHAGACPLIETGLEKELVWIPCCHHIMELILAAVHRSLFGTSGGPEMTLYKRFQKAWPSITKEAFITAPNEAFDGLENL